LRTHEGQKIGVYEQSKLKRGRQGSRKNSEDLLCEIKVPIEVVEPILLHKTTSVEQGVPYAPTAPQDEHRSDNLERLMRDLEIFAIRHNLFKTYQEARNEIERILRLNWRLDLTKEEIQKRLKTGLIEGNLSETLDTLFESPLVGLSCSPGPIKHHMEYFAEPEKGVEDGPNLRIGVETDQHKDSPEYGTANGPHSEPEIAVEEPHKETFEPPVEPTWGGHFGSGF